MEKVLFILITITLLLALSTLPTQAHDLKSDGVSSSRDDTMIIEMINHIDETLLSKYHEGLLRFGPRYTGSINCTLAAQYIYTSFQKMGLEVEFHEWRYGGFQSKNVVATHYGTDLNNTAEYIQSHSLWLIQAYAYQ